MIGEICNPSRITASCRMKLDKELKKDIDLDGIVKFLNDQKVVMDYAGLN